MSTPRRSFPGTVRAIVCTPFHLLLNRIDPPVIVLLYHRVATLARDPEQLAVTPEHFRAQLRHLKGLFPLVRFGDDWSRAEKPAVAITFDDGYADNLREALPILEEEKVPATFFVSTGTIGSPQEFWWHELERIMLEDHELPSSLNIASSGFAASWPTGTMTERQRCYRELVWLMNDHSPSLRNTWLAEIRIWARAAKGSTDIHRMMTLEELRQLAASRWVTIGAHTVTHSRLAALSPDAQRREICTSRQQLEQWLNREVTLFSYPFGRRRDYTGTTVAICREAGFAKAASNFPGQAHRWTDPYQVPRHLVRDWPVELFAKRLQGFWTR